MHPVSPVFQQIRQRLRKRQLWSPAHLVPETLRELSGSPARLERMGAAARQYARANHSPEENVRQREAVYDAVAAGANELCGSRNEPVKPGLAPARVD